MQTFAARRFAGSARGDEASVRVAPTGLEITVGGETSHWPYRTIRQRRVPRRGEPALLEREGGEALFFADAGVLAAIRAASPEAAHLRAASPFSFGARVALAIAGLAAFAAILLLVALPAFADWLAARVPVSWEESYGALVVEQVVAGSRTIEDPRVRRVVDRVVTRLAAAADPSGYRYRVIVIDRPEANALAAPGGHIVVFRGMLAHAGGPDGFAAVLAHEMEHVRRRHVTRGVFRRLSLDVLLAIFAGDLGAAGTAVAMARALGDLSFSRADEIAADVGGLARLRAAGFDPRAMPEVLERLSGGDDLRWAEFLASHPEPKQRARRLRELDSGAPGARPATIVTPAEWNALREAVAADSAAAGDGTTK